ncbi:MAG: SufE family protein [Alphaproteobacteria bacterium]|nr:SufE family protein [Alphaproteobacteria bacterium]
MAYPSLEELVENFSLFDDWEDRYKYLIDLGKSLPVMAEGLKTDQNLVKGCTSRVWFVAQEKEGGKYHFIADSDAHIVKGLIAILLGAYEGKTREEIANVDIEDAFSQMGLDQHLSPNRRNGFFAMVERVRGGSCF